MNAPMMSSTERKTREFPRDERGQVLVLVLILLAVGTLMATSFLTAESTDMLSARESSTHLSDRTAADAGVEHGIWRVRYDPTFVAGLTVSTPVSYQKTVDGMPVTISVTMIPTPTPVATPTPLSTPSPGHNVQVGKTVDPPYAVPGQATVFTYTIQISNTGTATIKLEQVWDVLPQGFTYVAGSSSGITSAEPTLTMQSGRQTVTWAFSSPHPSIPSGQVGTQVFRTTATPPDGTYYNEAWVETTSDSDNPASSGDTAPVAVTTPQYDIRASADAVAIRSRVRIQGGVVGIRSWREE